MAGEIQPNSLYLLACGGSSDVESSEKLRFSDRKGDRPTRESLSVSIELNVLYIT